MVEKINYAALRPTWTVQKTTRKDGSVTKQHRVLLRIMVDGKRKTITKCFPVGTNLDTERKRNMALKKWIAELEEKQDGEIAAEEAERRAKEEAERREAARRNSKSVGDAVDEFLDGWNVENSTMLSYRSSAKHIHGGFDGVALMDLDAKMVRKWLNKLKDAGYSASVQGKCYRLLNQVLKHLVMDGDLDRNVCDAVQPPKRAKVDPNALTFEGREKLVNHLNSLEPTALVVGAMTALLMGLREGEICGLRWRDVDLNRKRLCVRTAVGNGTGGTYLKAPKTDGSERTLPIPETLMPVLTARAAKMTAEINESGAKVTKDEFADLFVIGYIDGRYKNPCMLGREWKSMSESLNLKGTKNKPITFHDLRHSFATVAVANGTDIKSVSSFMGHSNAAMTLNTYASSDMDALELAAQKMDGSYDFDKQREGQADVLDFAKKANG